MNLITLADSYKFSHFNQYPEKTEQLFCYMEARTQAEYIIFFGLQYYLKKYLEKGIQPGDFREASYLAEAHGVPFHGDGWKHIWHEHGGKLPVIIEAVPEGMVIPSGVPLLTIRSADSKVPWLAPYLETLLLKLWYPISVATKSYNTRKLLEKYYGKDNPAIDFAFHNFGDRGSTCVEAAALGGLAHLTQFSGTDNFNALVYMRDYYHDNMGYSIPATEHSTVTSWGRDHEFAMIDNYLETYKSCKIIACVLDSYDIYKAVDYVTSALKKKIESDDYPIFVIRPDSGDPIEVIRDILIIMVKNGVSRKLVGGKYLFDKYRIIWGDGINYEQIDLILDCLTAAGYAPENIAFGSGGDLMQKLNRDTHQFAIKCSQAVVNGEHRDVYKDPATASSKRSKKGLLSTARNKKTGEIVTINPDNYDDEQYEKIMRPVFANGTILIEERFNDIRQRSR